MGRTASKMTMDATVWFAQNRPDMEPSISLHLANELGTIAESQNWIAPEADFEFLKFRDGADIEAFMVDSGALFESVEKATGYPEELTAVLSSVANFLGWKVPA
jgi:hypothetical protein